MRRSTILGGVTGLGTLLTLGYFLSNPKESDVGLEIEQSSTINNTASTKSLEQKISNSPPEVYESVNGETRTRPQQENPFLEQSYQKTWESFFLDSSVNRFYTREGFIDYIDAIVGKTKKFKLEVFLDEIRKADAETRQFLEDLYGSNHALEEAVLRLESNKHQTIIEYIGKNDMEKIASDLWNNGMDKNWERYLNESIVGEAVSNYVYIKNNLVPGATLETYTNKLLDLAISEGKIPNYTKNQREAITLATRKYDQNPTTENENDVSKLLRRATDVNPEKIISQKLKSQELRDAFILGQYIKRG